MHEPTLLLALRCLDEPASQLESAVMKRYDSGSPWESRYGYSRSVRRGQHVMVSGTVSDQRGDAASQMARALSIALAGLEALGGATTDVMRTRVFVVDIEADGDAIMLQHAARFAEVKPACSMVEVSRLIEAWMRVEVELDAIVL